MNMEQEIIGALGALSAEEREILSGKGIQKAVYSKAENFIVEGEKFLNGQPLDLRRHTRFTDFPEHGHNYMEFMYVFSGSITHLIGKETVTLERGDILFLNKHIRHSILRADTQDIGLNFILSDAFLQMTMQNGIGNPVLKSFIEENFSQYGEGEYLYFKTKDNFPIRNLMDNLIYAVVKRSQELYGGLVSLLFSYLSYYGDTLHNKSRFSSPDARFLKAVLGYLEGNFRTATLCGLAEIMGYHEAYLSRRIRLVTGFSFQELLQEKRLTCAANLLSTSNLTVENIIHAVGYENQSYFHRMFRARYGATPHRYRKEHTPSF